MFVLEMKISRIVIVYFTFIACLMVVEILMSFKIIKDQIYFVPKHKALPKRI